MNILLPAFDKNIACFRFQDGSISVGLNLNKKDISRMEEIIVLFRENAWKE